MREQNEDRVNELADKSKAIGDLLIQAHKDGKIKISEQDFFISALVALNTLFDVTTGEHNDTIELLGILTHLWFEESISNPPTAVEREDF